jgi:hypothetical protein
MKKFYISVLSLCFLFPTSAFAMTFQDVNNDNPYFESIEWLADNGILNGYYDSSSGNNFKPENCVNRVEFLKMLFETLQISLLDSKTQLFLDTPEDAWYISYIKTASDMDIIQGYPDGTFRPDQCVTRVEAIKMTLKSVGNWGLEDLYSFEYPFIPSRISFNDIDSNEWYYNDLLIALDFNLVGLSHTTAQNFYPAGEMTRQEAAEILFRIKAVKDNCPLGYYFSCLPNISSPVDNELMMKIEIALNDGFNIEETENPNFQIPDDISSYQIVKYFKLNTLYFAVVTKSTFINHIEEIPWDANYQYAGLLIAEEGYDFWQKYLKVNFLYQDPNHYDPGNNPYYLWNDNYEILLSVVDSYGGGSGEGTYKLLSSNDYGYNWELKGCYYYMPPLDYEDGNQYSITKDLEKFSVLDTKDNYSCFNYQIFNNAVL